MDDSTASLLSRVPLGLRTLFNRSSQLQTKSRRSSNICKHGSRDLCYVSVYLSNRSSWSNGMRKYTFHKLVYFPRDVTSWDDVGRCIWLRRTFHDHYVTDCEWKAKHGFGFSLLTSIILGFTDLMLTNLCGFTIKEATMSLSASTTRQSVRT
jgi:hypothetical protein